MQKFPKIEEGQVALVRADPMTGHVLDDSFSLYLNDSNQNIYTVFEILQAAKEYANEFLNRTNEFEFAIYDYQNNCIECWSPYPDRLDLKP